MPLLHLASFLLFTSPTLTGLILWNSATDTSSSEGNHADYKHFDKYNTTSRNGFEYSDVSVLRTSTLNSTYPTGSRAVSGREDLRVNIVKVRATTSNGGSVADDEITLHQLHFLKSQTCLSVNAMVSRKFSLKVVPVP